MINGDIHISNKLEVWLGNVISVPGCEPESGLTSTTLTANRQCNASVVSLRDALIAIPGSTLESLYNPRRLFFVLPQGPPPDPNCPRDGSIDYYAILRSLPPANPSLPHTIVEVGNEPTEQVLPELCSSTYLKDVL